MNDSDIWIWCGDSQTCVEWSPLVLLRVKLQAGLLGPRPEVLMWSVFSCFIVLLLSCYARKRILENWGATQENEHFREKEKTTRLPHNTRPILISTAINCARLISRQSSESLFIIFLCSRGWQILWQKGLTLCLNFFEINIFMLWNPQLWDKKNGEKAELSAQFFIYANACFPSIFLVIMQEKRGILRFLNSFWRPTYLCTFSGSMYGHIFPF